MTRNTGTSFMGETMNKHLAEVEELMSHKLYDSRDGDCTPGDWDDDYEAFQEYQEHGSVLSPEERAVEREKERVS
jgi:hypothetical protein